jgi:tetratricopeptide (TPR) repeat protein
MTVNKPAGLLAFVMALTAAACCLAGDASTQPTTAHGATATIWLLKGDRPAHNLHISLLAWELYRQAVLVAARDELGMQTRDESLREWRASPPRLQTLDPSVQGFSLTLTRVEEPPSSIEAPALWHSRPDMVAMFSFLPEMETLAEKTSRTDFPAAMRRQGWQGKPDAQSPDAPPPLEADALLPQLDELSQFAILRLTHAAIASSGESLPRLGVLVRAYANLGQITRYHWSVDSRVYTARSLLYAQRMVAKDPKSAFALWHRAYARALAGMQGPALDDLTAAQRLSPSAAAPSWVALLEPFCKYQTGRLTDLATADPSNTSLGMYLAFLTVENSGCQGAAINFAQAALKVNPNCLRLIDAMCDQTGPGLLNELTETGPQIFGQLLGANLEKMPAFPKSVVDLIHNLRRAEGNPAGRETVCQLLIDEGDPAKDSGEPSWAALGRQIQETTFAHVQRRANLIALQWGIDASDYTAEVRPLIADHPYNGLIEAYGLCHGPNLELLQSALHRPRLDRLTLSAIPLYKMDIAYEPPGQTSNRVLSAIFDNIDNTSPDIEQMLLLYGGATNPYLADLASHLETVSPHSPWLLIDQIHDHWDATSAAKWEADQGDFPSIAFALAQKYAELQQWSDAERCFKKYVSVSPDIKGYQALADIYLKQGQEDQWLQTLQAFLQLPAYGLEHATVQVQIANRFMSKGNYKDALPYADAAADTAAAWAQLCAAEAHAGVGDFDGAESLITDEIQHYSQSPYIWYAWCLRTGHGKRTAAADAMRRPTQCGIITRPAAARPATTTASPPPSLTSPRATRAKPSACFSSASPSTPDRFHSFTLPCLPMS